MHERYLCFGRYCCFHVCRLIFISRRSTACGVGLCFQIFSQLRACIFIQWSRLGKQLAAARVVDKVNGEDVAILVQIWRWTAVSIKRTPVYQGISAVSCHCACSESKLLGICIPCCKPPLTVCTFNWGERRITSLIDCLPLSRYDGCWNYANAYEEVWKGCIILVAGALRKVLERSLVFLAKMLCFSYLVRAFCT